MAHGGRPPRGWSLSLRRVLVRTRPGRALKRRLRPRAEIPVGAAPNPAFLLDFPGEQQLPSEIRDDRLVAGAVAWLERIDALRELDRTADQPLISVAIVTPGLPRLVARHAIESVLAQAYPRWELCLFDDGTSSEDLDSILGTQAHRDPRIQVCQIDAGLPTAAVRNQALSLARGDFVAFLTGTCRLTSTALLQITRRLNAEPSLDALGEEGFDRARRSAAPGWSHTFLRGALDCDSLFVVRRSLALSIGGFDPGFDDVHIQEFGLRFVEATRRLAREPGLTDCPAPQAVAGPRTAELLAAAVSAHYRRLGINGYAMPDSRSPDLISLIPGADLDASLVGIVISAAGSAPGAVSETLASLTPFAAQLDHVVISEASDLGSPGKAPLPALHHNGSFASAVATIESDVLLLVEAGVVLEGARCLAHLLLHALHPRAGVVMPVAADSAPASTACVLVPQKRLQELGGLSPVFSTAGYAFADLLLRARQAGLDNVVVEQAVARRTTTGGVPVELDRALLDDVWGNQIDHVGAGDGNRKDSGQRTFAETRE
jgi:hypothetical protein